jgi:3-methyladenine DNA glycosylase AlkD
MNRKGDSLWQLLRAIATGDSAKASRMLVASPELASAASPTGATRSSSTSYYFNEIEHYVYEGDTALHVAAAAYRTDLAKELVRLGANARARNRLGAEPIHYACDGQPGSGTWDPKAQAAVIAYLLDAGADPNAADKSGVTPLHRAVRTRCAAAVEVLLANGADPLRKNGSGSTALHLAVKNTGRGGSGSIAASEQQREIIRMLMGDGARPTDTDSGGKTTVASVLADLDAGLLATRPPNTASVRLIRRRLSRELTRAPADFVRAIAHALTMRDESYDRFVAAELLAAHPAAMNSLRVDDVRRLGGGMDSWADVDVFACILAGPLWRVGQLSDAEVRRWARSQDRWWRRAAIVSTVPLNIRSRGGKGDPVRTLAMCRLLLDDRDPMVVKALSWALRELAKREPAVVRKFLAEHGTSVPALVRREVQTKLRTGLKARRRQSPRPRAS